MSSYRQGQEEQLTALGLVVNCIALYNTIYTQRALDRLHADRHAVPAVGLAQLAAAAVKDLARERVAGLAAVEQVDGLGRAADLGDRAGERGQVPGVAAQGAHELAAGGLALQQAAGDAEQVVVVLGDQRRVEAVARELDERPVVGDREPREAGAAGVGQPRGELVAQQPEGPEEKRTSVFMWTAG